jgi:anion-transporting  ArsA/GET3 family ATPase
VLDRQLVFVTGKGGTGRTTVAAAVGLAAARRRRRVVICEVGGQARVPALLGAAPGRPGEEVAVADGLWSTTIDPRTALEEWLARVLGSRQLTHLLASSNAFGTFVGAVPGAAELVAITKCWELAQDERWDRRRRGYDLVVLDAPASGHGLGMLRTPTTFHDIARVGPIATQAARVREWLGDARRTGYLAVALAADTPVTETIELGIRLRRTIGRRLEQVVVNALLPARFTAAELAAIAARAGAPVARAVSDADARSRAQTEHLARLRAGIDARVSELPLVVGDRLLAGDVHALSERLALAG